MFLLCGGFVLLGAMLSGGCGNNEERKLTQQQLTLRAGKDIYSDRCVSCHGINGNGLGSRSGPSLKGPEFIYGGSEDEIRISVTQGRNNGMPPFQDILSSQEVDSLVKYLIYLQQ